ncbi:glycosyltransferase family 4 protein [Salinigranum halophilum]|uniref:glycosyltransferase family 4 protein n=1 Tax=Salinigranum halophilum TaxID=2565931 RepID=UPI0010A904E3|nr:glycosyltransferase family 4 protein [Salinigranum halophilum]
MCEDYPHTDAAMFDGQHICFITNLYPPETIGGAETSVRTVAEALVERHYEVSVITTASSDDARAGDGAFCERQNGVSVHRFTPGNLYTPFEYREQPGWQKPLMHLLDLWNPQAGRTVDRLLGDLVPDIIHVHNFGGLSPAVFRAAANHAPVVQTLHDYRLLHIDPGMFVAGAQRELSGLMRPFRAYNRRTVEPSLDRVLAPSQFIIDQHNEAGFFDDVPTSVLRLGVPRDDRATPGAVADPPRILFVGQLARPKGVDVLLDAIAHLDSDIRVDIVGRGEAREQLEAQAAGDDRVTFHGFVSEADLAAFYREATVTVVPSRWNDNSPMVIYESLARATPVVGSDMGGISELIDTPGDDTPTTGRVVPSEDPVALATAIESVCRTNPHVESRAAYARADDYTLSTHLDRLLAHYAACSGESIEIPDATDGRNERTALQNEPPASIR